MFVFNRQLVLLKIFLLCHFGAVFSFWPFVTLQGISAGVSMDQIAIVNSVTPLSSILGPLIAGFAADKFGSYKILYMVGIIFMSATTWGFLALQGGARSNVTSILNSSIGLNDTHDAKPLYQSDSGQFVTFFVLCMSLIMFAEGCYSLCDSIVISLCTDNNADLGKQRIFISLGYGIFPIVSGSIMDYTRDLNIKGLEGYSPTTYLSTLMVFGALMAVSRLNIRCVPRDKGSSSSGLWDLLKQVDVTFFLLAYVVAGSAFGFNGTYEFAYLNSLQAPSLLQGLPGSIGALMSVVVLCFSGILVQRLGPPRMLMLTLMAWCIKFIGFSFLTNPWFAICGALLDSLSIPVCFLSAACFCSRNAPPGLLATLSGALNASFFGLGKIVGGSIGGTLIHQYGFRVPYRAFSIGTGAAAILYCVVYHTKLKSLEEKRLQRMVVHEKETGPGHVNPAFRQEETTTENLEQDLKIRDAEITQF